MTSATSGTTALRTFTIDTAHSELSFQVRHLLTRVRGQFLQFAGTIDFDRDAPVNSRVQLTIQASSIDTNEEARDRHLRSDDFFGVETYPTITFSSTAITSRGEDRYDVEGDFTIRDVTRRIVLPVTYLGTAKDPWGNEKLAFEAETTLDRKEYGLKWNAALETGGFLVGDEVRISLAIQAM